MLAGDLEDKLDVKRILSERGPLNLEKKKQADAEESTLLQEDTALDWAPEHD